MMTQRQKALAKGRKIRKELRSASYYELGKIANKKSIGRESLISQQRRRIAKEMIKEGINKDLGRWNQEIQTEQSLENRKRGHMKRVALSDVGSLY